MNFFQYIKQWQQQNMFYIKNVNGEATGVTETMKQVTSIT